MTGLGFERLESVFSLAGGVFPISRLQYAKLMKSLLVPAVKNITDASCWRKLHKLQKRPTKHIAIDTTYSSRHWHANEITTLVRDAQAENSDGAIIGRVHLLKDTASGAAQQHPLRTYTGTSNTAEGDASDMILSRIKMEMLQSTTLH